MPNRLKPSTYPCPQHSHIDLTAEVVKEACADPIMVIADMVPGAAIQFDLPSGKGGAQAGQGGTQAGPFVVGVDCPGHPADGNGKAEPHRVYLSGEVR